MEQGAERKSSRGTVELIFAVTLSLAFLLREKSVLDRPYGKESWPLTKKKKVK